MCENITFSSISRDDVETEEKSTIFKSVFRENQACNHMFLLHHSVAGTRLKLQSKNKTNLWKGFFASLDLIWKNKNKDDLSIWPRMFYLSVVVFAGMLAQVFREINTHENSFIHSFYKTYSYTYHFTVAK